MELIDISSWIQIITSVFFVIVLIFSIFFWFKEKDKLRFFISLKDILDQIDSASVDSVNKEEYKQVIIENIALGTNRKSDDVAKILSTINDPVELEARKLLASPNFIIILITMFIISFFYLFQAFLDLGYISQNILQAFLDLGCISQDILPYELDASIKKSILNLLHKVLGICLTFLFMAYLFPLIKEFWAIIKKKFKNN